MKSHEIIEISSQALRSFEIYDINMTPQIDDAMAAMVIW